MAGASPDSLALLRIQIESALDDRGRLADCYGVTVASCADGLALWIGADVPDALTAELEVAFAHAAPPSEPTEAPPLVDLCAAILASAESVLLRSAGPSYLIPADPQVASEVAIVRSGDPDAGCLQRANPGNWHPVEWDELLAGQLGPWAIASHGDRAISVCHTPGPVTARAAECGVWTEPVFRGRGYAAATAAAWVAVVRSPQRHLFYSTEFDNLSSQRVAQRLGCRPIGWIWRLLRPRPDQATPLHPLCSLYRRASS